MIQAVIFDLDGVLVSTDEFHFQAWARLAHELGVTTFTAADNARQRGVSRMESLEVVLEKSGLTFTPEEKLELAARKNAHYVELLQTLTPAALLPNALPTLEQLRTRGVRIALGSASKNAEFILERLEIHSRFDAIASGNDTTRSKPDPQVFQVAAQKLGLAPDVCLVVEDADAGIQAGHAAGMRTLGVGPAQHNALATYCAGSLNDPGLDWEAVLR